MLFELSKYELFTYLWPDKTTVIFTFSSFSLRRWECPHSLEKGLLFERSQCPLLWRTLSHLPHLLLAQQDNVWRAWTNLGTDAHCLSTISVDLHLTEMTLAILYSSISSLTQTMVLVLMMQCGLCWKKKKHQTVHWVLFSLLGGCLHWLQQFLGPLQGFGWSLILRPESIKDKVTQNSCLR